MYVGMSRLCSLLTCLVGFSCGGTVVAPIGNPSDSQVSGLLLLLVKPHCFPLSFQAITPKRFLAITVSSSDD